MLGTVRKLCHECLERALAVELWWLQNVLWFSEGVILVLRRARFRRTHLFDLLL